LRRVVFCLGHLGEQVAAAVGDGASLGMQIDYVYDGPRLLGTGGALKLAAPLLGEDFFVLYGDSYLRCDYAAIEQRYRQSKQAALMTVYDNQGLWDASNVEFRDGQIVAYSKSSRTPRMRHIDYGLGVLSAAALAAVPADRPSDLATVYGRLALSGSLAAFEVSHRFYEIGSFAGLKELETYLEKEDHP
jgi:NDP-sugar pyrophosphorylase family protein